MTPVPSPQRSRPSSFKSRFGRLLALGASALLAVSGVSVASTVLDASPAQAADPTGCSYGTNGPRANTICWLDFAGLDPAQVQSAGGQNYELELPGGYTASFDLTFSSPVNGDVPVTRTGAQGWAGSQFYRVYYQGVAGSPLLYSTSQRGKFQLNDIEVLDPTGAAVTGYSLIAMDGEGSNGAERLIWESDKTFFEVGVAPSPGLGCSPNVVFGGTTLDCLGGQSGTVIAGVTDPTWISAEHFGGDDVVFGIEFAKLELRKEFAGRVGPTDSVDLVVESPAGTEIDNVSTGAAQSTTTGGSSVLPVGAFELGESPTAGTETLFANYDRSWSCENRTAGSTTALPNGATGAGVSVSPQAGDDIVCTITNTAKARSLAIVKSLVDNDDRNDDGLTDAGDRLSYEFEVTNTGALELHGLQVSDPKLGAVSCAATTLAPEASTTCTAPVYTVTAADVTAGTVDNTATASALPPGSSDDDARVSGTSNTVQTPTQTPAPALTVVKSSDHGTPAASKPGDTVTYTFTVENTGNVPVSDIAIAEGQFTGSGELSAIDCPAAQADRLDPGDIVECTATYVLTQSDVDGGAVSNTATATGENPDGGQVTSPPSGTGVEITAEPGFDFEKRAVSGAHSKAGDVVEYEFELTNTGNVSITDYTVTEGEFTGTDSLSPIDCPTGAIAAGASIVCTASYTLTQADVDAGGVTNTATASIEVPRGQVPPPAPSTFTLDVPPAPGLAITKTSDTDRVNRAGQKVTYSFELLNTGNVTLSDATVIEGKFTGKGAKPQPVCPAEAESLAPGESVVCTAVYTVVAADLTGSPLQNTASATARTPGGERVDSDETSMTSSATSRTEGGLAVTGGDMVWASVIAATLLIGGGAALILVKRRKRSEA